MWHNLDYPDPPPLWRYTLHPPAAEEYTYFEDPPPGENSPQLKWAAWMADAAMLAYGRHHTELIDRFEFTKILERAGFTHHALIGNWGGGPRGTQAYFAYNPDFAVVSFRGTEPDDWKDLAVDAFAALVRPSTEIQVPNPAKTLFHLALGNPLLDPGETGVHAGFQLALNEVWRETEQWVTGYAHNHPDSTIYFTGHSLGAALATLAFARYNSDRAQLFTFGSPRVGNAAFCGPLNKLAGDGRVHRFVNGRDLVTHAPTTSWWYAHTEGRSFFQEGVLSSAPPEPDMPGAELVSALRDVAAVVLSDGVREDKVAPDALRDHAPVRYCHFLWRAKV